MPTKIKEITYWTLNVDLELNHFYTQFVLNCPNLMTTDTFQNEVIY